MAGFPVAAVAAPGENPVIINRQGALGYPAAEIHQRFAKPVQGLHHLLAFICWAVIGMGERHNMASPGIFRVGWITGDG